MHYAEQLYDELHLWVYPIVLGQGKRAFEPGDMAVNLRLIEPARTSAKGTVQLRYALAEGVPEIGDMSQRDQAT